MRKLISTTALTAAATLALAGCSGDADSDASNGEWPDSITISLVPSTEGEDLAEALDPLTEYLSDGLGIDVEGVVANDYSATVEALGSDQAQVIITDAGSLYQAINQHDAQLILRDERFGATSYASVAYTNDPDKYCEDDPVEATYAADDSAFSYCNGIEEADGDASGEGPAGEDALAKIDSNTKVAMQSATSPAGYQYPIVAMRDAGVDTDSLNEIPVEGNNNAILAVNNGDADVAFGYWDARTSVLEEEPDINDNVVAFAYTEMIPNGGVAVSNTLPEDLSEELAQLMDDYADSSDEAKEVMNNLVGLTDWTTELEEDQIERYGEILEEFQN